MDSYLKWFYETAVLLRELLSEKGSIYVHCDWRLNGYIKVVLDEVFGYDNFLNEVIWQSAVGDTSAKNRKFIKSHDSISVFAKSTNSYTWNDSFQAYSGGSEKLYANSDEQGRYQFGPVDNPGGGGYIYDLGLGEKIPSNGYRMPKARALEWLANGSLLIEEGRVPRRKLYMKEEGVRVKDIWLDISGSVQKNYPTQKPQALLERIIKASSNPGDLVLDCFCGSGTTAAVSEMLGRRWITCDLGRFAIHTARKRLLAIPNVKPFVVQNLGKYERQHWQIAEFGDAQTAAKREAAYRSFILDLYRARPLSGALYLHGVKGDRRVFVGGVDSPVSLGDLKNISTELKKTMGTGADAPTSMSVDILGWDFAFDLNETGKAAMQDAGINARFVRIPREVLERKAVEQGDIKFFELAALEADVQVAGKTVSVTLSDFVMPTDDVPYEVQTAITHWSQWIDYWAVDWDNKNDTFHNEWQDYRTRKKRDLQYRITHPYAEPGTYQIVIKVIDILGNDTTKTVSVVIS